MAPRKQVSLRRSQVAYSTRRERALRSRTESARGGRATPSSPAQRRGVRADAERQAGRHVDAAEDAPAPPDRGRGARVVVVAQVHRNGLLEQGLSCPSRPTMPTGPCTVHPEVARGGRGRDTVTLPVAGALTAMRWPTTASSPLQCRVASAIPRAQGRGRPGFAGAGSAPSRDTIHSECDRIINVWLPLSRSASRLAVVRHVRSRSAATPSRDISECDRIINRASGCRCRTTLKDSRRRLSRGS